MAGPAPLTYPDILAWSTLHRLRLVPWEVDAIKSMDLAYLRSISKNEVTDGHGDDD